MAHPEIDTYFPDFFDGETLEKIDALGVAAAKSILAAEKATGTRAQSLYDKAEANMQALCKVVRASLAGNMGTDPFDDTDKAA